METLKSEYIEIPNEYGYYTINIDNGKLPELPDFPKKPKKPTSDPRSPYDVFKPEKKTYYKQLPIPGLIYPLAKRN